MSDAQAVQRFHPVIEQSVRDEFERFKAAAEFGTWDEWVEFLDEVSQWAWQFCRKSGNPDQAHLMRAHLRDAWDAAVGGAEAAERQQP